MSDTPQTTHFADDATLTRMVQLERDLAAAVKERDALRDTVAEWEQDVGDAMAGACCGAGDEAHCACVPALKIGMKRLRKERDALRELLRECEEWIEMLPIVTPGSRDFQQRIRAALERKP